MKKFLIIALISISYLIHAMDYNEDDIYIEDSQVKFSKMGSPEETSTAYLFKTQTLNPCLFNPPSSQLRQAPAPHNRYIRPLEKPVYAQLRTPLLLCNEITYCAPQALEEPLLINQGKNEIESQDFYDALQISPLLNAPHEDIERKIILHLKKNGWHNLFIREEDIVSCIQNNQKQNFTEKSNYDAIEEWCNQVLRYQNASLLTPLLSHCARHEIRGRTPQEVMQIFNAFMTLKDRSFAMVRYYDDVVMHAFNRDGYTKWLHSNFKKDEVYEKVSVGILNADFNEYQYEEKNKLRMSSNLIMEALAPLATTSTAKSRLYDFIFTKAAIFSHLHNPVSKHMNVQRWVNEGKRLVNTAEPLLSIVSQDARVPSELRKISIQEYNQITQTLINEGSAIPGFTYNTTVLITNEDTKDLAYSSLKAQSIEYLRSQINSFTSDQTNSLYNKIKAAQLRKGFFNEFKNVICTHIQLKQALEAAFKTLSPFLIQDEERKVFVSQMEMLFEVYGTAQCAIERNTKLQVEVNKKQFNDTGSMEAFNRFCYFTKDYFINFFTKKYPPQRDTKGGALYNYFLCPLVATLLTDIHERCEKASPLVYAKMFSEVWQHLPKVYDTYEDYQKTDQNFFADCAVSLRPTILKEVLAFNELMKSLT